MRPDLFSCDCQVKSGSAVAECQRYARVSLTRTCGDTAKPSPAKPSPESRFMGENAQSFRSWARSRRFVLSHQGRAVEADYMSAMAVARGKGGRGAFENARVDWASRHALEADHGFYLVEIRREPITISALGEALAVCSQSREDILRCVERLVEVGLVQGEEGETRA